MARWVEDDRFAEEAPSPAPPPPVYVPPPPTYEYEPEPDDDPEPVYDPAPVYYYAPPEPASVPPSPSVPSPSVVVPQIVGPPPPPAPVTPASVADQASMTLSEFINSYNPTANADLPYVQAGSTGGYLVGTGVTIAPGSSLTPTQAQGYLDEALAAGVPPDYITSFLAANPNDFHRILTAWNQRNGAAGSGPDQQVTPAPLPTVIPTSAPDVPVLVNLGAGPSLPTGLDYTTYQNLGGGPPAAVGPTAQNLGGGPSTTGIGTTNLTGGAGGAAGTISTAGIGGGGGVVPWLLVGALAWLAWKGVAK